MSATFTSLWRRSCRRDSTARLTEVGERLVKRFVFVKSDPCHHLFDQVKVIDMTGREQRVMTGYSAISGQQRPGEEGDVMAPLAKLQEKRKANFELPELLHNLDLLVDMCEQVPNMETINIYNSFDPGKNKSNCRT